MQATAALQRGVQWRFKGSNTAYSSIPLPLPIFCGEVRSHLKAHAGLLSTPQLDALLFFADDPSTPLSDLLSLRQPCSLLLQRTSAEEAKKALDAADRVFQEQQHRAAADDTGKALSASGKGGQTSGHAGALADPRGGSVETLGAASTSSNQSFRSAGQSDAGELGPVSESHHGTGECDRGHDDDADEAALLQAVIEQHAEHRGPQPNLGSSGTSAFGEASRLGGVGQGLVRGGRGRGWWGVGRSGGVPVGGAASTLGGAVGVGAGGGGSAWGSSYAGRGGWFPSGGFVVPVSEDYVCYMCGERGHHIRNCSRSNDPRHQKKVRPATGIPSSFLRDISVDDIPKYAEVYIRKDGSFAVMKDAKQLSSLSYFSSDLDTKIERHVGSSDVAAHLKCPLCHHLFSQPVATPCCGESFCRNCLTLAVDGGRQLPGGSFSAKSTGGCPSCGKSIDLREVLFNTALQKSVDAIVHSKSSLKEPSGTFSQAGSVLPVAPSPLRTAPATSVVAAAVSAAGPAGVRSVDATASSASSCANATCVKGVKGALPGQSTFASQVTSSVAAACVKKEKDGGLDTLAAPLSQPQTIAATKTGVEGALVKTEDTKKQDFAEPTQFSGVKAGSVSASLAAVTNRSAAVPVANGSPAGNTHSGHAGGPATVCHESEEANGEGATDSGNGRKTDVQSGLPVGIDLKQLQQQQDFAAAYIEQYLRRKQKKRRKPGNESDKSSEKSDSDRIKKASKR